MVRRWGWYWRLEAIVGPTVQMREIDVGLGADSELREPEMAENRPTMDGWGAAEWSFIHHSCKRREWQLTRRVLR